MSTALLVIRILTIKAIYFITFELKKPLHHFFCHSFNFQKIALELLHLYFWKEHLHLSLSHFVFKHSIYSDVISILDQIPCLPMNELKNVFLHFKCRFIIYNFKDIAMWFSTTFQHLNHVLDCTSKQIVTNWFYCMKKRISHCSAIYCNGHTHEWPYKHMCQYWKLTVK